MGFPIVGRLDLYDYIRLAYALLILIADKLLRVLWPIVPSLRQPKKERDRFLQLRDTAEMVEFFGYTVEEHIGFTSDGHMLMLFKIPSRNTSDAKPPILMLHGAMLSSDIWMVHREADSNLPLWLASLGYDVWLGNRRGNKYCAKHCRFRTLDPNFWDWSMDEVALYDIPCLLKSVLRNYPKGAKCVVIGFSQGSAELFASLALIPEVNSQVGLAIGLAAMTRPAASMSGPSIISALIHGPPQLLYLLFGRRSMLSSVLFWMEALPSRLYSNMIDGFLQLLFGWNCKNISKNNRRHMYMKLYSYCSVKCIAHWFQMARARRFQMFDEGAMEAGIVGTRRPGHVPPAFPLKQIRSPIVLFSGERDSLADHEYTQQVLKHCVVEDIVIEDFEHLDFLMADNVREALFPSLERVLSRIKFKRPATTATGISRHSSDWSLNK
jgi:lysosomal acid lipase/cholesteryl ester hydrolase